MNYQTCLNSILFCHFSKVYLNSHSFLLKIKPEDIVNVEGLRKAMGITYHPTSNNKSQKKINEFERTGNESNVLHDETVLDHSSPPDVSSDDRLRHQDLETDLREFLETGPILRVCDSPTG